MIDCYFKYNSKYFKFLNTNGNTNIDCLYLDIPTKKKSRRMMRHPAALIFHYSITRQEEDKSFQMDK
jgi:hypothetical protein